MPTFADEIGEAREAGECDTDGKAVSMGAILAAVARILSDAQQAKLKIWIAETLPRTTREIGAWIEAECGISYESRSGPIALLHRLGMEHRKPSPPP